MQSTNTRNETGYLIIAKKVNNAKLIWIKKRHDPITERTPKCEKNHKEEENFPHEKTHLEWIPNNQRNSTILNHVSFPATVPTTKVKFNKQCCNFS